MQNPFTLIPARLRLVLYIIFAFLGLALGGVQAGYAAANVADPTWLIIALAIFGIIAGPLGVTAASNVTSSSGSSVGLGTASVKILADVSEFKTTIEQAIADLKPVLHLVHHVAQPSTPADPTAPAAGVPPSAPTPSTPSTPAATPATPDVTPTTPDVTPTTPTTPATPQ